MTDRVDTEVHDMQPPHRNPVVKHARGKTGM
jgi:hypothetical protein